jgi:ADP-heptose:LPS heptosyltransferase
VLESAALMRYSAFVVTVNSGPMHLASAANVACIVLMGGRDFPGSWDPLGDEHIILRHPVSCGGCQFKECPVEGHPCMTGITVEQAVAAIDRMCR